MCYVPRERYEFDGESIPSTESMMRSARKNNRFIDMRKARVLSQGFTKGYNISNSALIPLNTLRVQVTRNPDLNKFNVTHIAEKQYEGLLDNLGDEYKGYKETFVNNGDKNPSKLSDLANQSIDLDLDQIGTASSIKTMPSDYYGSPFQVGDKIANYGKFPTFDMQKWNDSGEWDRIYDAMESDWDPSPKTHDLNGRKMYLPGGIENILAAFGVTWDKDGNRKYDYMDNPFLTPEKHKQLNEAGKRTGINNEKEEETAQFFQVGQFHDALHGNPEERKAAQFIYKFLPGLVGRTHAYTPDYWHHFSPHTGHVYVESPDQVLRPNFGWSGAGNIEEIIHAIDHLASHEGTRHLSNGLRGRPSTGLWKQLDSERWLSDWDPIGQGAEFEKRIKSGELRAKDVRNISELLSNAYLLDKRRRWLNTTKDVHGPLFTDYSRTWLNEDVAHPPGYYVGTTREREFIPTKNFNSRTVPEIRYPNLNAEMFNNVLNPFITGNRLEQQYLKKWFPHMVKWVFDAIGEASDRIPDEDIGTKVSLKKSVDPDAPILY